MNFNLNENEVKEYYDFCDEHKSCVLCSTIGGKISVEFIPTGLGEIKVVKCKSCGVTKDITDISNW